MFQSRLKKHFVEKEEAFLSESDMYQTYLEACASMAAFGVDVILFNKVGHTVLMRMIELIGYRCIKETLNSFTDFFVVIIHNLCV